MSNRTEQTFQGVDEPRLRSYQEELRAWRRDFHQHPELAFEEVRTSGLVAERLESFGLEPILGLGGTGVVAVIEGSAGEGRSVGLRADMDALPILEENDFEHRSTFDGKMHACGHDGHTTMLLGAARYLAETRDFAGRVVLVFQPAEEKDGGARKMMDDGLFEQFPVDEIYGMHNLPGADVGSFAMRPGPMMAAVDTFGAIVRGGGGHAAFPHTIKDTLLAATEVVTAWQTIVARNVDPLTSAVLSVTIFRGGDAHNVVPASVELGGCVRTFEPHVQDLIERRMAEIGQGVAAAHGLEFELDYQRYYPATVNTEDEVGHAARVIRQLGHPVDTDMPPIMGSEDFSFYLQERPGAFVMTGNGASAGLHTPGYDFNDELLFVGARYWIALAQDRLGQQV